ncbi:MAG TPA: GNAT family N-acetyltransferase [Gemmatimonadaceae bacterium]
MPRSRADQLRIREIVSPDDPLLPDAYRLLRSTFHKNERVLLSEWKATLRERARQVWTDFAWHLFIAERNQRVVGLATGTYLGNVNVAVIGYLAIDRSTRAAGLGTRLRVRLRDAFRRDARQLAHRELDAVLGEVSATNPWLAALARRPSVLVLNFPYFQPRLYAEDQPSPFVLYFESIGRPRRWLAASELRRILYAIWRRAYRISRPLERPAFRRMLNALEGRRRIGPHPDYQGTR